ncbi:MAG TPA: S8 family peptidase [Puia sp.]|nr:S8 family peptidase [Puia sp.]
MNCLQRPPVFLFVLCCLFGLVSSPARAQQAEYAVRGWHLLDYRDDRLFGAGVTKAYNELLKGRKSHPVVVAIIDDGIDTAHEDLKGHIWTNKKEIPGNGLDDDHNGYVDDVHGWNFLGGKDGRNIDFESYESYREYYRLNHLPPGSVEDSSYGYRLRVERGFLKDSIRQARTVSSVEMMIPVIEATDSLLKKELHKDSVNARDLQAMEPTDSAIAAVRAEALQYYWKYGMSYDMPLIAFIGEAKKYLAEARQGLARFSGDPNAERRDIVKDDFDDINDRGYGNNNIAAGAPMHGTHVAGIIAASRNNGLGVDGIADKVLIMPVRAVPVGDERDKDIALAIRYAVDNGAQIINLSFGKYFSPGRLWVDEAEQYAEDHDVLLVHAAGNDALDIDTIPYFPAQHVTDQIASCFLTVAASTPGPDSLVVARYTNYGLASVSLFAPGVKIYSTLPGNRYETYSGTSMAAPMVCGVAALLLEYYPKLSAKQLKYVITHSVMPLPNPEVRLASTGKMVNFSSLSVSGGIVNAYNAFKLAANLKGERKKPVYYSRVYRHRD